MHELSIAQSLIELACEAALREGGDRIERLNLRIGQLSGVVREALEFSFALAAEGTACEGAAVRDRRCRDRRHVPAMQGRQNIARWVSILLSNLWDTNSRDCGRS